MPEQTTVPATCPNCAEKDAEIVRLSSERKFYKLATEATESELEDLQKLVKNWACDTCNIVYPGPPQKGFSCVVCPQCGGNTAPKSTVELLRVKKELSVALAEIEGLKDEVTLLATYRKSLEAQVAKDHAELSTLKQQIESAELLAALKRIQKASHCNVSTYGIWIKGICDEAVAKAEQQIQNATPESNFSPESSNEDSGTPGAALEPK